MSRNDSGERKPLLPGQGGSLHPCDKPMGTMRLLSSHSPSVIKPSQAMRAADRDPAGGEGPWSCANSRSVDAYLQAGVREE